MDEEFKKKYFIKIKYTLKFFSISFIFVPLFLLMLLHSLFYLEENPIRIYLIICYLIMFLLYFIMLIFSTMRCISINGNEIYLGRYLINDIKLKLPVIYYLDYNNFVINNKYKITLEFIKNINELKKFLSQGEKDQKMIKKNNFFIEIKYKNIIFLLLNILVSYFTSSFIVLIIYDVYNKLSFKVFIILVIIFFVLIFLLLFYFYIRYIRKKH